MHVHSLHSSLAWLHSAAAAFASQVPASSGKKQLQSAISWHCQRPLACLRHSPRMNACTKSAAFCSTSGLTVCGVVLISTCKQRGRIMQGKSTLYQTLHLVCLMIAPTMWAAVVRSSPKPPCLQHCGITPATLLLLAVHSDKPLLLGIMSHRSSHRRLCSKQCRACCWQLLLCDALCLKLPALLEATSAGAAWPSGSHQNNSCQVCTLCCRNDDTA